MSQVRLTPKNSYLSFLSISEKCKSIQKVTKGNRKSILPEKSKKHKIKLVLMYMINWTSTQPYKDPASHCSPVVLFTSMGSCAQLDWATVRVRGSLFHDTKCKITIYFFPSFQNRNKGRCRSGMHLYKNELCELQQDIFW